MEVARPHGVILTGPEIDAVLQEAGITKEHPEWGLHWNLVHAWRHPLFGCRAGSTPELKRIYERELA